jgi:LmbE family N-acetylglucosaminyl deacetylase
MNSTGGWDTSKKILAIFAHPDDPEFFCGATIARWASEGHTVVYHLLTRGDKGTKDPALTPQMLGNIREKEQKNAAAVLGVSAVHFSNFGDGCLLPDMELRKEITRVIRRERPDVLLTTDPTNFFPDHGYVNHPDHRYAGQAVLDAAFPGSGFSLYFPELEAEGLAPWKVNELLLTLTHQPDVCFDVTFLFPTKIKALLEHKCQIGDPVLFEQQFKKGHTPDSSDAAPRYEETFRCFEIV